MAAAAAVATVVLLVSDVEVGFAGFGGTPIVLLLVSSR